MRTGSAWVMGLLLGFAGCGDDAAPMQGSGAPPVTSPPASVIGAGSGGGGAPLNPGTAGVMTGQPPMTPMGMMPVAGSSPTTAGTGGMMMMAGRGGMGGRGGRAGMGGAGMGGAAGMAGAGTAGAGGMSGCVENLTCKLSPPPSTGDVHQDCVDRINQFRTQCACLTPLARWMEGEACADMMAEYDSTQPMAHAGFRAKICMPGGSSQNECPGWRAETQIIDRCLQSMWDEGPPPTQPCDGDCFQTYGHFINMTSTRSTQVACGFFTTPSGQIWSVQNFTR